MAWPTPKDKSRQAPLELTPSLPIRRSIKLYNPTSSDIAAAIQELQAYAVGAGVSEPNIEFSRGYEVTLSLTAGADESLILITVGESDD